MAKRILIVDDQIYVRQILKFNLEKEGFEVYEAKDGNFALQHIKNLKPDLVLLDLMMPDVDGFEVLEKLQKEIKNNDVNIIIVSAKAQQADILRVIKLGATKFIKKPYKLTELLNEIKQILNIGADEMLGRQASVDKKEVLEKIKEIVSNKENDKIPIIEEYLKDENLHTDVRVEAAIALGHFHDDNSINVLLETLETTDPVLKEKIIWSLGKLKNRRAFAKVITILKDPEETNDLKMAAVIAIKSMGFSDEVKDIIDNFKASLVPLRIRKMKKKKKKKKDK